MGILTLVFMFQRRTQTRNREINHLYWLDSGALRVRNESVRGRQREKAVQGAGSIRQVSASLQSGVWVTLTQINFVSNRKHVLT